MTTNGKYIKRAVFSGVLKHTLSQWALISTIHLPARTLPQITCRRSSQTPGKTGLLEKSFFNILASCVLAPTFWLPRLFPRDGYGIRCFGSPGKVEEENGSHHGLRRVDKITSRHEEAGNREEL